MGCQRVARAATVTSPPSSVLRICGPGVSLAMAFHKFKIGQRVSYEPSQDTFPGWYVVVALLPEMNGKFRYQIRRCVFRLGRERKRFARQQRKVTNLPAHLRLYRRV